jgi:hypothetical protein
MRNTTRFLLALSGSALLLLPASAGANGTSFYRRVGLIRGGELRFVEAKQAALPHSSRMLLTCASKGSSARERCLQTVRLELAKELAAAPTPDLKAWKWLVAGTMELQLRRFAEAEAALRRGAELAKDAKLAIAIKHRMLTTYRARGQMRPLLARRISSSSASPSYDRFDRAFDTYPEGICAATWLECDSPTAVRELEKERATMVRIAELEEKMAPLKVAKNAGPYLSSALQLAQGYEKLCPVPTIIEVVCSAAVEVYRLIYARGPRAPGADFAFLRIQESKLAYEYEGDDIAESRDHRRVYEPFLKQYPTSKLAPEIRRKVERARRVLGKNRP